MISSNVWAISGTASLLVVFFSTAPFYLLVALLASLGLLLPRVSSLPIFVLVLLGA